MVGEVARPEQTSDGYMLFRAVRLDAPATLRYVAVDAVEETVREDHRFLFYLITLLGGLRRTEVLPARGLSGCLEIEPVEMVVRA